MPTYKGNNALVYKLHNAQGDTEVLQDALISKYRFPNVTGNNSLVKLYNAQASIDAYSNKIFSTTKLA